MTIWPSRVMMYDDVIYHDGYLFKLFVQIEHGG